VSLCDYCAGGTAESGGQERFKTLNNVSAVVRMVKADPKTVANVQGGEFQVPTCEATSSQRGERRNQSRSTFIGSCQLRCIIKNSPIIGHHRWAWVDETTWAPHCAWWQLREKAKNDTSLCRNKRSRVHKEHTSRTRHTVDPPD